MVRTIQFIRFYYTFSCVSSLIVNGKIIQERKVESPGHVRQEDVSLVRHWDWNNSTFLSPFFYIVTTGSQAGFCDVMLGLVARTITLVEVFLVISVRKEIF